MIPVDRKSHFEPSQPHTLLDEVWGQFQWSILAQFTNLGLYRQLKIVSMKRCRSKITYERIIWWEFALVASWQVLRHFSVP